MIWKNHISWPHYKICKRITITDQLCKLNSYEDMKKLFEPVTDTVQQIAQETIGAVNDTTKAYELKGKKQTKHLTK